MKLKKLKIGMMKYGKPADLIGLNPRKTILLDMKTGKNA